jgi:hypothetical protein
MTPPDDLVVPASGAQTRATAPDDVAARLTINVDGPEVTDLRADSEIASLGTVISLRTSTCAPSEAR